jgi:hypothetical protein
MKKIIVLLISASMLLTLFSCGKTDEPAGTSGQEGQKGTEAAVVTTNAPDVKKKSSASTKAVSDYLVESIDNFKVDFGTSYEDVLAMLPKELDVEIPFDMANAKPSEVLFEADFSSMEAFLKDWVLQGNPASTEVHDGKYCVVASDPLARAYVKHQPWSNYDPETGEGHGYANYAVKAVIHGTQPTMTNIMGILFRAGEVEPEGDNAFDALYYGVGNAAVRLYKHNHDFAVVMDMPHEYQQDVDYTLEAIVFNNMLILKFNGEKIYEGETEGFENGTVGFRTWTGLYECTEFTVRTLGPEDYEQFGGYTETVRLPVTWECWDYNPEFSGKYGFFATVNSDMIPEGKQAQQKVNVTVKNAG